MVPLSNEIACPKKTPVKLCFFHYNKKNLGKMVPLLNEIARPKKTLVKLCFFYYNKKNLGTLLELAMPLSIFKVNVHFPYHSLTTYIEQ